MNSKKTIFQVTYYLRENWGAPFIVIFVLLLISAAALTGSRMQYMADSVSAYAFYSLVAGVLLQFASFLKFRKKAEVSDL